jgi:8-oxo-dGTP pyrophosphatase MutT (NUDIX family)
LNAEFEIVEVADLDFAVAPEPWDIARTHADRIAALWAQAVAKKPALYNGRVLLLGRRALAPSAGGALRLSGVFFETDYATFTSWKTLGFPGPVVENAFSMAAIRAADGAFLMGEMAPHTFNAGQIYFPAGTPDPSDVFDGRVDLDASARRELFEETGLDAGAMKVAPGWSVIFAPPRLACMKRMTLAEPAEEARARIDAFLARDPHAEFSRMHVVRTPADIDRARTPPFVAAWLDGEFARE